jgi:hypothetical protein
MFAWAIEQSVAVQRLLSSESARVLGFALSDQQADAVVAVEACARAIGRVPSRDAYRAWHREPDNFGWPSSKQIEGLFDGSWAGVAAALTGEVAPKFDLRAARLTSQAQRSAMRSCWPASAPGGESRCRPAEILTSRSTGIGRSRG